MVYKWLNNNHTCLLCNETAEQPYPLCVACEAELPWLEDGCQVCALPLPMHGLTCGQCSRRAPAFYRVEAPWHYGFPLDALISRFKYHSQWPLGHLLAQLLGRWLTHRFSDGLPRPALLLPVPLSRRRLRQRGYNQAAMLARWLAGWLRTPVSPATNGYSSAWSTHRRSRASTRGSANAIYARLLLWKTSTGWKVGTWP
ncbi:comF family protein [compost metagenome]